MSQATDQITKARQTVDSLLEQTDKAVRDDKQIDPRSLCKPLYDFKFALAFLAGYIGEER